MVIISNLELAGLRLLSCWGLSKHFIEEHRKLCTTFYGIFEALNNWIQHCKKSGVVGLIFEK